MDSNHNNKSLLTNNNHKSNNTSHKFSEVLKDEIDKNKTT